jgi:hypothetical protein
MRVRVESGAGEASLVERLEERGLVDQRASRDVHESHADQPNFERVEPSRQL